MLTSLNFIIRMMVRFRKVLIRQEKWSNVYFVMLYRTLEHGGRSQGKPGRPPRQWSKSQWWEPGMRHWQWIWTEMDKHERGGEVDNSRFWRSIICGKQWRQRSQRYHLGFWIRQLGDSVRWERKNRRSRAENNELCWDILSLGSQKNRQGNKF